MRVDVLALQRFYGSPLGGLAHRMVEKRLATLWGDCAGLDVLGVGYAPPWLDAYRSRAKRAVALMPAAQGAERWPGEGPQATTLAEEGRLPFADAVFDRCIIVHALEEAERPARLLREIWRVMAPEGRLVVIAANRTGLWALGDRTPFGHGRPYSRRQLSALLAEAMFEPTASAYALHAPPLDWPFIAGIADGAERAGEMLGSPFGGLVLMEAVKRLYVATAKQQGRILLAGAPIRAAPHLRERRDCG